MDDDSPTLFEQSRQLIAAARAIVQASRCARASAQAACRRAEWLIARAHDSPGERVLATVSIERQRR